MKRHIQRLFLRLRSLISPRRPDGEVAEELAFHVDMQTSRNLEAGMAHDEARRRARIEFGGLSQTKEDCRRAHVLGMLDCFAQDVRYALRQIGRTPSFTAAAVLSLAAGIGLNAAVFGILDQFLLQPPTAREPQHLAAIELGRGRQISYPNYVDLARSGAGELAAYTMTQAGWSVNGVTETLRAHVVTANYFDVLGTPATIGRTFTAAEARAELNPRIALLSHRFWELRLASDPSVIGRQFVLDGQPFSVIGVLPRDFRPLTGPMEAPQLWVPVGSLSLGSLEDRTQNLLFPIARFPRGTGAGEALRAAAARLEHDYPRENQGLASSWAMFGIGGFDRLKHYDPETGMLAAAALVLCGLVFLTACANVSSLLLARGAARRREIAMRFALGAGRARLVRQLLTETLLIALAASFAAALLNVWVTSAWNRVGASSLEVVPFRILPGAHLAAYILAAGLIATFLTGMLPALASTRAGLAGAIKDEGPVRLRLRGALVAGQVTISVVLLVIAALFTRSLLRIGQTSLGFDVDRTLVATVNLPAGRYAGEREQQFFEQAVARIGSLPGVESAASVAMVPLSFNTACQAVHVADSDFPAAACFNIVGAGYFRTMGIALVRGREYGSGDRANSPPVAIVNQAFARRYLGGATLGARIATGEGAERRVLEIVGVASDTKYLYPGEAARPQVYLSASQPNRIRRVRTIVARATGAPTAALATVRQALLQLDSLADVTVVSMRAQVSWAFWPARVGAGVLGGLGLLGVLLATVGLYGVVSYSVSRRRRDIGLRMALGASRGDVLRMVLRSGLRLVGAGAAVGLPLAVIAPRPLAAFLASGISPSDPLSFAAALLLTAIIGAAASLVPAWRASRLDPVETLRYE